MSQENVELVVRQFEAANARDFSTITDAWAQDVTLVTHGDLVRLTGVTGSNVVAGKAAVGDWFRDWFDQFARDYRFEIDQVHDLGDRVLVLVIHHARGRTSGVPVTIRSGYLYTAHGGKVGRMELWDNSKNALEAVGLSQENFEAAVWIETARRAIEAWNREDLDAFLEEWHPDCEWRPAFPRSLEGVGTVYRGREGIARAWSGVRAVWEEYRLMPEDAQVVSERLVVVGHVVARGKESGLELDSGWSGLATYRDELTLSAWDWLDRDEARRAAGLEE